MRLQKCLRWLLPASALASANSQKRLNSSTSCSELSQSFNSSNVAVNFAQYLPAGTNISLTQDYDLSSCGYTSQVVPVDLCRIAMHVATSSRSGITLEAWLPTNWTGRFLSTGNGGVSGCIQYPDLAYTAGLGFATVGANNGHNGTRGIAFYNNSDVVHDFVDRSMHTGVVIGKQLTNKYYGTPHKKSYYLGCSTGGRQGFKAVQDYPEDFDGVVAGAPALAFAGLSSWSATFYTYFGNPGDETYIPPGYSWSLVHQEILNQCDGIDGVVDGIIEDPTLCQFRPEALLCSPTSNSTSCLNSGQVGALRRTFTDYYGLEGALVFPRMQPGSELLAQYIYYTAGAFLYSSDWFRYVVHNNPSWDPASYSRRDAEAALSQNPFNVQTFNGDLSAFHAAGGKLLHYHGLADPVITSTNSPRYYNHVSRTMNLNSSSLDDFYRFFRISGMGHCDGGVGAHMLGQTSVGFTTAEPQRNVLMRMVDWVENGNPPETVTGVKYVDDDETKGVAFVRDHCKYPLRNICLDPNNYTSPDAWECVL